MEGSHISIIPAIASSVTSTLLVALDLSFPAQADARVCIKLGSRT